MTPRIIIIIILGLAVQHLNAQTSNPAYSQSNIKAKSNEKFDAVIHFKKSIFEVFSPAKAKEVHKFSISRLNHDAPFSELRIDYNNLKKVKNIKVRWYNAAGELKRSLKKKNIEDLAAISNSTFYSDSRYKYVDLGFSSFPYTVEYEYEIQHEGLFYYPGFYFQYPNAKVLKAEYQLIHPENMDVQHRVVNIDAEYVSENKDQKQYHTWTSKDMMPPKFEAYAPNQLQQPAHIYFAPSEFEIKGYAGSMKDWNAVGKFIYELNEGRNNLSASMKNKVQQLTADAATDAEKVAILYQYLQKNHRYVSVQIDIGGWLAYDAQYVEQNKFGDCKALTWYMKSMLEEIGITAYPVLVKAGSNYKGMDYPEDFSFPNFNHVILYVPDEEIWLECTSPHAPVGYLGLFTEGRKGMLIRPEGGKLIDIPTHDATQNRSELIKHYTLTEEGSAHLDFSGMYQGILHENIRFISNINDKNKQALKIDELFGINADLWANLNIRTFHNKAEAVINGNFEIKRFANKSGKRLFLTLIPKSNRFDHLNDISDRSLPVEILYGYTQEEKINVQLPKEYLVEKLPTDTRLESQFGSYSMTFKIEDKNIICVHHLNIKAVELPAETYKEYCQFINSVTKSDKRQIVLKKRSTQNELTTMEK